MYDGVYNPNVIDAAFVFPSSDVAIRHMTNRPGVAGAVLQTALLLINSVSDGLWKYIQNSVNPKPEELES